MSYDIALTENPTAPGTLIVHTANCETARFAAAIGEPVFTMIGCEKMPDEREYPRHDCLRAQKKPRRQKRRG